MMHIKNRITDKCQCLFQYTFWPDKITNQVSIRKLWTFLHNGVVQGEKSQP